MSRRCHNLLQSVRSHIQGAVLCVHIGPHSERWIGVPEPRGDHCDGHRLRMHDAGARMPRVVQPDLPNLGRAAQRPPEVAERVGMVRAPSVIDNDVLSSPVAIPICTGNSSARCAATAASTAERGEANAAHTPSPVCLNNQPPCASMAVNDAGRPARPVRRITACRLAFSGLSSLKPRL